MFSKVRNASHIVNRSSVVRVEFRNVQSPVAAIDQTLWSLKTETALPSIS